MSPRRKGDVKPLIGLEQWPFLFFSIFSQLPTKRGGGRVQDRGKTDESIELVVATYCVGCDVQDQVALEVQRTRHVDAVGNGHNVCVGFRVSAIGQSIRHMIHTACGDCAVDGLKEIRQHSSRVFVMCVMSVCLFVCVCLYLYLCASVPRFLCARVCCAVQGPD